MADGEDVLRLPKPIQISSCDMRPELLSFSGERRWDLLGFVRPDEVDDVKACNMDESGTRYYLVNWKDSWKPESSLIYCEKLLQQFWARKSILQQNDDHIAESDDSHVMSNDNTVDNITQNNTIIIGNTVKEAGNEQRKDDIEILHSGFSDIRLNSSENTDQTLCSTNDSDNAEQEAGQQSTPDDEEDSFKSDNVDLTIISQTISTDSLFMSTSIPHHHHHHHHHHQQQQQKKEHEEPDQQPPQIEKLQPYLEVESQCSNDHQEQEEDIKLLEYSAPTESNITNDAETPTNHPCRTTSKPSHAIAVEGVVQNIANIKISDVHSKKGASKRKNRLPRQSVQTSSLNKTKKDKTAKKNKDKSKKKISKEKFTTIVETTVVAVEEDDCANNQQQEGARKKLAVDTSRKCQERRGVLNSSGTAVGGGVVANLKCMVCDKQLTSQQNLMKHLLTHNNNHTCTICMKTFKSTHFLKHHMDKHNASYEYACPVCHKKFKFKNNMRGHLRKHNMEKKFECDVCHKKFIGKYNLKEHMKAHSDERPFECDFCRKSYKDRGALNKHLLTHQEKKVECEVCRRPFTNNAQLKRHMQFHFSWPGDSYKRKSQTAADGEKLKYTCEYCEKTFNHYSNMNAHIHKKHKEKKVECKECSKMFAYQYELREHMFIHSGGQEASKFKCQYCEKSFQRSTTLKNHERTTHLGIKRFKCDICGKMFGTKFNMKVHVEKLHSNGDTTAGESANCRQSRMSPITNEKEHLVELGLPDPTAGANVNFVNPDVNHPNVVPSMAQVSMTNPLLRNMTTSDIIRNAMSNMPELGYFPGLQPHSARAYQFYGIPPPDFGVS